MRVLQKSLMYAVLLAVSGAGISVCADAPVTEGLTTKEILRRADEARGNIDGVRWQVDINAVEKGEEISRSLDVRARGYDFLAVFLAPPKTKGQRVLFVEHNMWYAKPGVRKPVPISSRQSVAGGAAYGDIAATNFSEDYDATSLGEEIIDDVPCLVYDLQAVNKKVTYDRVKYWVSKERAVAVKAEYYTVSGKMFKSARFEFDHTIDLEGRTQPFISRIVITDALLSANVTTMLFSSPSLEKLSDSTFDANLLMSR